MLACGTTTCEIKSGYGLDVASELRMLRAIAALQTPPRRSTSSPTFMGAHEIPPEYRDRRDDYVELVIDEMIPAVAAEKLAAWCDVFCETGVFTPDESLRILEAGVAARTEAADPRRRTRGRAADRRWQRRSAPDRPIT